MKFSNLTRIYINSRITNGQIITITGDILHYCRSVLRMKISEEFRIFNENDGEFKVKITEINRNNLKFIVGNKLRDPIIEKPLILGICIIKPDRFLEAVKGAVQLGVAKIIPIISERTQFKNINYDRVQRSIIEATEQSENFSIPILHAPIKLLEFCSQKTINQIIFANEDEDSSVNINSIKNLGNNPAVLVGSEGGFSNFEQSELIKNPKVISISLGNTVLKSEVATIALLSCIKFKLSH